MPIRLADASDLPAIVAVYNASIPGRMATADTEAVSVADRQTWFREFDRTRRPLWVEEAAPGAPLRGWLSLRSFYGRPACRETVEVGVYTAPDARRLGVASTLLSHGLGAAPELGISTMLAFVFGHNLPSIALFRKAAFRTWGRLPAVAKLDGKAVDLLILGRHLG
jgi:phosphinothricin acetyltransferase